MKKEIKKSLGKVIPPLCGLADAADILGWDKRKVSTYIKRGAFPEPIQRISSGPIWTRNQIQSYKKDKSPS